MATSDGLDGCLQRGRSQSDPNILTEPGIDLVHSAEVVDQQRVLRTGCLVTGVHTPPIRRNSKLATLGRLFKPWKWRKKRNEKLKQSSTDVALSSGLLCHDPSSPTQGCCSDGTVLLGGFGGPLNPNLTVSSVEYLGPDEEHLPSVAPPLQDCERVEENISVAEDNGEEEVHPAGDLPEGLQDLGDQMEERPEEEIPPGTSPPQVPPKLLPQMSTGDDSGPVSLPAHMPNSYLPKEPPPRAPESMASMTLPLRGPLANPSGSPHLGNMIHPPMPPSCIMEELQRAFKEAEENKENVRLDQCFSNTSGLPTDLDGWNESVISGTLPRRLRKELLAVKLRNRPSKQELEDRNIFPARSDQERQEIRQQIEMKLMFIKPQHAFAVYYIKVGKTKGKVTFSAKYIIN
uniref:Phosphatase and actin regulator 3a n=1 Tax=Sphaeramia orbicularis TaxID=375764 RepID=A0A672YSE9_9TELE